MIKSCGRPHHLIYNNLDQFKFRIAYRIAMAILKDFYIAITGNIIL